MSNLGSRCEDCGPTCEACEGIAYCWSEQSSPPCPHDRPLCGDCNIENCLDCRLAAERDMHQTGVYDPRSDPFYIPANRAASEAYWANSPREVPGSPGTFRYPEDAS